MWLYPDGSRILELSTKCVASDAFQVAAESRAFLASKGVDLYGEQQTKTKAALEFFSKDLGRRAGARSPDVDARVRRVAVDLGQLLFGEVELFERRHVSSSWATLGRRSAPR